MKVILVGGFLGSGKTTLVLQLAKYLVGENPGAAAKVVIIENEIGEVGIDDRVLQGAGYRVQGLFSGCVCCTLSGELVLTLGQLLEDSLPGGGPLAPEYIIMEATGVAFPLSIKEVLKEAFPGLDCSICCVADASRWQRLALSMGNILKHQLDGADMILINKIDTIDENTLAAVDSSIRTLNPNARYFHLSGLNPVDSGVWAALA
jgi:G3E family GTPase